MDLLSIVFLIVFILLGGVIAVIADELGRRIGKRRLTFHKRIRPKHAARILTFLSGTVITLCTIVLISIASSDVRAWLREGSSAIKTRDKLLTQVDGLRKEQTGIQQQNAILKADNRSIMAASQDLKKQIATQKTLLDGLQAKLAASQGRLNTAQNSIASLNSRLASLDRSIADKTKQKEAAQASTRLAQKSLGTLKSQYAQLEKDHKELSSHDLELDQKLRGKEAEVKAKETEIADKAKQITDADESIRKLNDEKAKLEQERVRKQGELTDVQDQLRLLTEQASGFVQDSANRTRFRPLIFSGNEELARIFIPSGSSKDQVRQMIERLLGTAQNVAKEHGAGSSKNHDILITYAGMVDLDSRGNQVPVERQKEALAIEMAGYSDDQVLIVYAFANAFADEGVVVKLGYQANPVVYQSGQTLAEVRIDGHQTDDKILQGLTGLGERVRSRALTDKMIPISKGEVSFGSVSPTDVLRLVNEIRGFGGIVKVQARAKRLTRAADPLLLDFQLR